jgi:hypothetical protein
MKVLSEAKARRWQIVHLRRVSKLQQGSFLSFNQFSGAIRPQHEGGSRDGRSIECSALN